MKTRKKTNFKKNIKIKKKYNKSIKKFNRKYNKFSKKNNRKYNKFSKKNNRKIEGGGFGSVLSSMMPNKSKTAARYVTDSVAPTKEDLAKWQDKIAAERESPRGAQAGYDPTAVYLKSDHSPSARHRQSLALRKATKELGQSQQRSFTPSFMPIGRMDDDDDFDL